MCNYSEGVINKGLAKGIAQGIEKGMAQGIEKGRADVLKALRELGVDEETIQKAAAKAG